MRVGLDVRHVSGADRRAELAEEADRLGLWAVLVDSRIEAAALATTTEHVHFAVAFDAATTHPVAIAEQVAILDHLSRRRALAVVDGAGAGVDHARRLLAGEIVDGVALAPPPAQTVVPVWPASAAEPVELSGDLDSDRVTIDGLRDSGRTHVFVRWPGALAALARHLETRARTPDFPQIVADLADRIEPLD